MCHNMGHKSEPLFEKSVLDAVNFGTFLIKTSVWKRYCWFSFICISVFVCEKIKNSYSYSQLYFRKTHFCQCLSCLFMVMTKFVIPYYKMFWLKDGEDGLELHYKCWTLQACTIGSTKKMMTTFTFQSTTTMFSLLWGGHSLTNEEDQ